MTPANDGPPRIWIPTPGSPEAQKCKPNYEACKQLVLEARALGLHVEGPPGIVDAIEEAPEVEPRSMRLTRHRSTAFRGTTRVRREELDRLPIRSRVGT